MAFHAFPTRVDRREGGTAETFAPASPAYCGRGGAASAAAARAAPRGARSSAPRVGSVSVRGPGFKTCTAARSDGRTRPGRRCGVAMWALHAGIVQLDLACGRACDAEESSGAPPPPRDAPTPPPARANHDWHPEALAWDAYTVRRQRGCLAPLLGRAWDGACSSPGLPSRATEPRRADAQPRGPSTPRRADDSASSASRRAATPSGVAAAAALL